MPGLIVLLAPHCLTALQFESLVDDWMISDEILLVDSNVTEIHMDIASDGTNFMLVWDCHDETSNSEAACGVIVDGAGQLRPETRFMISAPGVNSDLQPQVASNGTDYLVVWREVLPKETGYRLMASRVSRAGGVLDPDSIEVRRRPLAKLIQDGFDVGSNGSHYLLAWGERGSGLSSWTAYGIRIDRDGNMLELAPKILARPSGLRIQIAAGVNGAFRIVASSSDNEITSVIDMAASGEVTQIIRDFPQANPSQTALASNGTLYFAIWDNDDSVVGSRLPASFSRGDVAVVDISRDPQAQTTRPSIASDGNGFLLAWSDSRNQGAGEDLRFELLGARVSAEGELLDDEVIPIVAGPRAVVGQLASSGSAYLASIWDSEGAVDTIKAKLIIDPDRYLILSEPARTAEGAIEFQFNAAPGHAFAIEHTKDFTEWHELQQFNDFSGEAIVTDNPEDATARFYRARRIEL